MSNDILFQQLPIAMVIPLPSPVIRATRPLTLNKELALMSMLAYEGGNVYNQTKDTALQVNC